MSWGTKVHILAALALGLPAPPPPPRVRDRVGDPSQWRRRCGARKALGPPAHVVEARRAAQASQPATQNPASP